MAKKRSSKSAKAARKAARRGAKAAKPRKPMRDPVFTQTMQVGIVVRDLDATMRKYVDEYGIGPWKIYEFNAGNANGLREYGQPVERSWRLAVAMVGNVQWELIEPLDDEGIYARFLAEKGGGVHHIAVAAQRPRVRARARMTNVERVSAAQLIKYATLRLGEIVVVSLVNSMAAFGDKGRCGEEVGLHARRERAILCQPQGKCANTTRRIAPALRNRLTIPCFVKYCSRSRYSGHWPRRKKQGNRGAATSRRRDVAS
jgi:hypothetical protein